MAEPNRTRDEVIEATLKAACIRASATSYGSGHSCVPVHAHDVVRFARDLYLEATRYPWRRGDDPPPTAGVTMTTPGGSGGGGASYPVVVQSGGTVQGIASGAGGAVATPLPPVTVQINDGGSVELLP